MATTLGVTGPQRLVIRMIGRFPGITAGQLARLFHVHPGTLTPMLKRLERDGLVQRRADPRDARRSLLGLTATGRQLHGATAGTIEDLIRAALASVSSVEVKGARAVLESIVRTLEDNSIKGTTQRRRHR
ncbi:MAG: MarR family transcriptional regulator [Deltaproteobacteria bacterium]|nr:MarR family transcriptional regulator [Deltaproteobacteria bacterium]